MKPAERIPLLKRLAKALAAIDDEDEIDLILGQFGFRTGTVYESDFYGYALGQLERSGNDEKRLDLERYLEPAADEASARPASSEPGPWRIDNSVRLFISHPHSLAPLAASMRDWLGRFLIEAFVAHEDIEPSKKWTEVIESALLTCHAAAALVTPDFRTSAWCDQEIGFASQGRYALYRCYMVPTRTGFSAASKEQRWASQQARTKTDSKQDERRWIP